MIMQNIPKTNKKQAQ